MAVITTQSAFPVNVYADKDIRVTATSADQVSTIRALFMLCRRNLTTEFSLRKRIKCFLSKLRRRKIPSGKSRDYRNYIVFEKLRFPKAFFFLSTRKRNAGVLKFLQFQERFRKDPFS